MPELVNPDRFQRGYVRVFDDEPPDVAFVDDISPVFPGEEEVTLPRLGIEQGDDVREKAERPDRSLGLRRGEDLLLEHRLREHDPADGDRVPLGVDVGVFEGDAFGHAEAVLAEEREEELVPRVGDDGEKLPFLLQGPHVVLVVVGVRIEVGEDPFRQQRPIPFPQEFDESLGGRDHVAHRAARGFVEPLIEAVDKLDEALSSRNRRTHRRQRTFLHCRRR